MPFRLGKTSQTEGLSFGGCASPWPSSLADRGEYGLKQATSQVRHNRHPGERHHAECRILEVGAPARAHPKTPRDQTGPDASSRASARRGEPEPPGRCRSLFSSQGPGRLKRRCLWLAIEVFRLPARRLQTRADAAVRVTGGSRLFLWPVQLFSASTRPARYSDPQIRMRGASSPARARDQASTCIMASTKSSAGLASRPALRAAS